MRAGPMVKVFDVAGKVETSEPAEGTGPPEDQNAMEIDPPKQIKLIGKKTNHEMDLDNPKKRPKQEDKRRSKKRKHNKVDFSNFVNKCR